MTTNQEDTKGTPRQGADALREAVDASPLEAAPESQTSGQGTSFYNPALTGSGTILPDGTYGSPLPDPNLERVKDLPTEPEEVTVEPQVATRSRTKESAAAESKPAPAKSTTAAKSARQS